MWLPKCNKKLLLLSLHALEFYLSIDLMLHADVFHSISVFFCLLSLCASLFRWRSTEKREKVNKHKMCNEIAHCCYTSTHPLIPRSLSPSLSICPSSLTQSKESKQCATEFMCVQNFYLGHVSTSSLLSRLFSFCDCCHF